jgi:hypothetical protein
MWVARSLVVALLAGPAAAGPVEVDVELVLMVDASRSMGPVESRIQRKGYAAALSSDEVVGAILEGALGRVAVTYVEWGGELFQRTILPWTVIDSRTAADRAARMLLADFDLSMAELHAVPLHLRQTSISGAIRQGQRELALNDYEGLRRVIDISGDGPNNDGLPVTEARDAARAEGIVVNGLPLMLTVVGEAPDPENVDLHVYFAACVVGGPGAFVLPALGWDAFPQAVRRKLALEIARGPEDRLPAEGGPDEQGRDVDCLMGEKARQAREHRP